MTEHRIHKFAEKLEAWSFDEERAKGIEYNVAKFRNEFRDMYDENFPWAETKKNKRDKEKPCVHDRPLLVRTVKEFRDLAAEKYI